MADLAILIPLLGRPHRVAPLVDSIARSTVVDSRLVFLLTDSDSEVLAAVQDVFDDTWMDLLSFPPLKHGDYARKINAGFEATNAPYLFLGADDLEFHRGWDNCGLFEFNYPAVGVVGTQDLGNSRVLRGEHSTHSFVSRTYVEEFGTIDRPGQVLHERYPHEFVDDEFIETAKFRGAFKFCNESVVEHLHPLWGKAPSDQMYEKHRHRMRVGRTIYARRKHLWT